MKIFLISLIFSLTGAVAFGSLSIEGSYQGKNLYVQNPMDDDDNSNNVEGIDPDSSDSPDAIQYLLHKLSSN